jgi:hypothetical protein
LTEILVSVNGSTVAPDKYTLSQNYPNPFNPSTIIEFNMPKAGNATLKVYDLRGREVATLFNQYLNAGLYNKEFIANGLSSGLYIYALTVKDNNSGILYKEAKRMTLVK